MKGFLDDKTLTLIKRYPHYFEANDNGEIILYPGKPCHEIHFVGNLISSWFSRRYFVEGRWDISGSFLDSNGDARYYTGEGDWEMQRRK